MRTAKTRSPSQADTRKVKRQTTYQSVVVWADGAGVVSTPAPSCWWSWPTGWASPRRGTHDPGVVRRDLAISIADAGDHVSHLGALRGQRVLVGAGAVGDDGPPGTEVIDVALLEAIRAGRAKALARTWIPAPALRS